VQTEQESKWDNFVFEDYSEIRIVSIVTPNSPESFTNWGRCKKACEGDY